MKKRITISAIGVLLCAISVAFFKYAALGIDSFQVFMNGMTAIVPIGYGTLYVIVNAAILLFAFIFGKQYIGLATLINLFFLGYIVEFVLFLLHSIFPAGTLLLRILFLVIGIVVMSLAAALCYVANLGVSTYDAVALIIAYTWKLGKFRYCRIGMEVVTVLLGTALYYIANRNFNGLSSFVGIGTILTAFCMGPLIEFFTHTVAEPLLKHSWHFKGAV